MATTLAISAPVVSTPATTSAPAPVVIRVNPAKDKAPCNLCSRLFTIAVLNARDGHCYNCQQTLDAQARKVLSAPSSPAKEACPGCGHLFHSETLSRRNGICHNCEKKANSIPKASVPKVHEKSICAGTCGREWRTETLNERGGVCWNCYRSQHKGPKSASPSTKELCPGGCGKEYLSSTLRKNGGTCHRCQAKASAPSPVVLCPGCNKAIKATTLRKNGGRCGRCVNSGKGAQTPAPAPMAQERPMTAIHRQQLPSQGLTMPDVADE
jgi:hypothetical protein